MQIVVNSEPREAPEGTTVGQLVEQLGLQKQYAAVEVNLRLVPRPEHAGHVLRAGDRVEIVTLVGGG
jgi:thiamine biosynthesis protein ThiS